MRPAHRVRQFSNHLRAQVAPAERAAAHDLLPATATPLFDAMPVADQRHALDVVRRLHQAGLDDADLLAAALLHDAAKSARLRLWHRVVVVLLEAIAPRRLRYPFHLHLHHAERSARAALDAGCGPRVAAFIQGTPDGSDTQLEAALRAADAAS
jgi:hypothetical protein